MIPSRVMIRISESESTPEVAANRTYYVTTLRVDGGPRSSLDLTSYPL